MGRNRNTLTDATRRLWVFATYLVAAGLALFTWVVIGYLAPETSATGRGPSGAALILGVVFACYMGYAVRRNCLKSLKDFRQIIQDDEVRETLIRAIVRAALPWGLVLGAGAGLLGFEFGDLGTLLQLALFLLVGIWVDSQETRSVARICRPWTGPLWA